jgi:hypothetical protein
VGHMCMRVNQAEGAVPPGPSRGDSNDMLLAENAPAIPPPEYGRASAALAAPSNANPECCELVDPVEPIGGGSLRVGGADVTRGVDVAEIRGVPAPLEEYPDACVGMPYP